MIEDPKENLASTSVSDWKQSLGARTSALGVIGIIVLGNLWFIYALTGKTAPSWTGVGFVFAGSLTVAGVMLTLGTTVVKWFQSKT